MDKHQPKSAHPLDGGEAEKFNHTWTDWPDPQEHNPCAAGLVSVRIYAYSTQRRKGRKGRKVIYFVSLWIFSAFFASLR
jgi:hypothetical protein